MEAYSLDEETPEKKRPGRPKGLKRYDKNPFLENQSLVDKHKKVKTSFAQVISNEAVILGEKKIGKGLFVKMEREVSGEKFVKMYARHYSIWFDLSNSAMRVFGLIFGYVLASPNETTMFFLSPIDPKIKKHIKTETLFYRAIRELIDQGFLARHVCEGWYWVNPFVLGKGDVIKTLSTLRLDKSKKSLIEIDELISPDTERKM